MSSPSQRAPVLPPKGIDSTPPESGVVSYDPRPVVTEEDAPDYGQPVRVVIPAIGVDSPLVRLGLNEDNTLEVPDDYRIAGWYINSSVPGDPGPAIIAGHVDSYLGPGVFYSLTLLRPGDEIVVEGKHGSIARFVVERVGEYPKAEFPTEKVYGAISYPGLRLITCGGAFNHDTRHYQDNVIVFARLAA